MISISTAVWIVVYLVIGGIIFGLLNLLVDRAPFMPEGSKPIIKWILLVLAILVLIGILLTFLGGTPVFRA